MPIYQYQCSACNASTERVTHTISPPPPNCPDCGTEMKTVYCSSLLKFKGSGFYVNDYKPTVKAGGDE